MNNTSWLHASADPGLWLALKGTGSHDMIGSMKTPLIEHDVVVVGGGSACELIHELIAVMYYRTSPFKHAYYHPTWPKP